MAKMQIQKGEVNKKQ